MLQLDEKQSIKRFYIYPYHFLVELDASAYRNLNPRFLREATYPSPPRFARRFKMSPAKIAPAQGMLHCDPIHIIADFNSESELL